MKKSVRILMIAFIAFSCTSEQSHLKSDLAIANIKGNVWKINKTIHETGNKCGCVLKTECNQSKYVYDKKGNLLESYTIDENGSVNDSTKYVYNRRGVCSEMTRFNGKKLVGKEVPVHQGGKLKGYRTYNENGIIESTLNYVYSGDEISEEKTLNSKGEVVSSVQNEFLNGHLFSQTEKDSNGNIKTISKIQRNVNNDIIEYLVKIPKDNSEFRFTFEYEYDNAGNWIKQTKFYNDNIINIIVRNIEYYEV